MRPKRLFIDNSFYHIYNRGNRKQWIFKDENDFLRFSLCFFKYLKDYDVKFGMYCLMPNHFHFLVHSGPSPQQISLLMQRFLTSYVLYLNRKHHLVGRLFQSPYNARYVGSGKHLETVVKYIRNNPVKAGLVTDYKYYRWLKEEAWLNKMIEL